MYSNFPIYSVAFLVLSAAANVPGQIPLEQRKSLDGKSLCIPSYGGIDYDVNQDYYRKDSDMPQYELYFQDRKKCAFKRLNNSNMGVCSEIAKNGKTTYIREVEIKGGEFFCHTEMLKQKFVEKDYGKFKLFLKRGAILQEKKVPNGYRFPGRKFAIFGVCEIVDYYYEISAGILNGIESCTLKNPCKGEELRKSVLGKFEKFVKSLQNFSIINTDINYNDPKP
ncbi:hypothetical protein AYI70_g5991 [Smittium culicis]|uniref:Uncharacterized protein n=1 Tax=Smittium culicis TaxID=133412 RepID=A0A1R1XKI1_9FUNG|nr:hypothetical protein AYI70_g7473 [Smittium culicis]OMJ17415.1 hypothetical protein AYI70_g5991 [Smittium culicis]